MKISRKDIDGAWEEKGVIGTRIEISGNRIIVLWMSAPVLETTFRRIKRDGAIELVLKQTGMRYRGSYSDYANVESIIFTGDSLEFRESFPISGEKFTVLSKTEDSRYGNCDICDEIIPELQGTWICSEHDTELTISKNTISIYGYKRRFHVLRSKNDSSSAPLYLADEDPSVRYWQGFCRFEYSMGTLRTEMMVCDAPSVGYVFERKEK